MRAISKVKSLCVYAVIGCWLSASLVFAQTATQDARTGTDRLNQSALALAPQDTAFMWTNLNMRQTQQEFLQGNFVSRLRAVPFIQRLEAEFLEQWENPNGQLAQIKDGLENPNIKNLVQVLLDMTSQEAFVWGGNDWCESYEGFARLYSDLSMRNSDPAALAEYFKSLDKSYFDMLKVPSSIIGFRLSDDQLARNQLDALQAILQLSLQNNPNTKDLLRRLKRQEYPDGQSLSITLDPAMIKLNESAPEGIENLIKNLEGRSLTIAIGIRSKVLMLAINEGDSPFEKLVSGEASLLDHSRLQIIKDQATADLRSVGYISARWQESQWKSTFGRYFSNLVRNPIAALEIAGENVPGNAAWRKQLLTDSAHLDGIISKYAPKFGEFVSWSFRSDVGMEGYAYSWTENKAIENASPLSVLSHAGTAPRLLLATNMSKQPMMDELFKAISKIAPGHLRQFVTVMEQDEDERDRVLKIVDRTWPIIEEAYQIISGEIAPALARQSLVSFTSQWSTVELTPDLPPAENPLPLPEIGIVLKLEHRDQFLSGCEHLYGVMDKVVELVREFRPDFPNNYVIPRPQQNQLAGATQFFYPEFATSVPFEGFMPQVVVSDDVVVVGYSERQVRDLLDERQLATRPAWFTPDMKVAAMSYVDFGGSLATLRPWISYGLEMTYGDLDLPVAEDNGPVPTGNDVLQIWDCLASLGKTASTTTISDDGVSISRWVWVE